MENLTSKALPCLEEAAQCLLPHVTADEVPTQ